LSVYSRNFKADGIIAQPWSVVGVTGNHIEETLVTVSSGCSLDPVGISVSIDNHIGTDVVKIRFEALGLIDPVYGEIWVPVWSVFCPASGVVPSAVGLSLAYDPTFTTSSDDMAVLRYTITGTSLTTEYDIHVLGVEQQGS